PSAIVGLVEGNDHRVLAAPAELWTLEAVGEHLLEQPCVRHDREAHLDEVAGRMRERAELLEAFAARAAAELLDDPRAHAGPTSRCIDRQRSYFGHRRTERRELGAADDRAAFDGNREALGMDAELPERSRQQVAFLEVGGDQRMQPPR